MDVVTQTDHPKSVRNRCVVEVIGLRFVLSRGIELSVGIVAFVIGLSQISFFSSSHQHVNAKSYSNENMITVVERSDAVTELI